MHKEPSFAMPYKIMARKKFIRENPELDFKTIFGFFNFKGEA